MDSRSLKPSQQHPPALPWETAAFQEMELLRRAVTQSTRPPSHCLELTRPSPAGSSASFPAWPHTPPPTGQAEKMFCSQPIS